MPYIAGAPEQHAVAWSRAPRLGEGGTTAVEFALIAPALLLLLVGSMKFGEMVWTAGALNFAVQQAARCASVTPGVCGSASQIATYAAAQISPATVPSTAFTASTAGCGHQVTASFLFPFVATTTFPATVTLTATACMA